MYQPIHPDSTSQREVINARLLLRGASVSKGFHAPLQGNYYLLSPKKFVMTKKSVFNVNNRTNR